MKRALLIVTVAGLALAAAAQTQLVSGVTVVVDDQVITYGEIADKVQPLLETAASVYQGDRARFDDEVRHVRDQQIESLVERKLELHAFNTGGTIVTNLLDAVVEDRIKKLVQEKAGGDRSRFIQTLHAQGKTLEMFRREVKEEVIVGYQEYQNVDQPQKIIISPLKIEEYYKAHPDSFKVPDQVKLRMIAIRKDPTDDTGAGKKQAEAALAKITAGAPFAEVANAYQSTSMHAVTNGGDRGWVDRTYFKPELADAAFNLRPGQHSGVIELPEACYILQVEDVRSAHVNGLGEVRGDIEHTLIAAEKARLRRQWIDRLKAKSYIQYF